MNIKMLKQAEEVTKLLSILANKNRLLIVCILIEGELCAGEIIDSIGTTKGNISQHIKLLLLTDIIKHRKDGNKVYYSIKNPKIIGLIKWLKSNFCE